MVVGRAGGGFMPWQLTLCAKHSAKKKQWYDQAAKAGFGAARQGQGVPEPIAM